MRRVRIPADTTHADKNQALAWAIEILIPGHHVTQITDVHPPGGWDCPDDPTMLQYDVGYEAEPIPQG